MTNHSTQVGKGEEGDVGKRGRHREMGKHPEDGNMQRGEGGRRGRAEEGGHQRGAKAALRLSLPAGAPSPLGTRLPPQLPPPEN